MVILDEPFVHVLVHEAGYVAVAAQSQARCLQGEAHSQTNARFGIDASFTAKRLQFTTAHEHSIPASVSCQDELPPLYYQGDS